MARETQHTESPRSYQILIGEKRLDFLGMTEMELPISLAVRLRAFLKTGFDMTHLPTSTPNKREWRSFLERTGDNAD
jgi:hypothetical protein